MNRSFAAVGALVPALVVVAPLSAELIVVDFESAPPGEFVTSWEESGVVVTSTGGSGLLSFWGHPSGTLGVYEATADVDVPIRAELPGAANSAWVRFTSTFGDDPWLRALDEEGNQIDFVAAPGLSDPFGFVDLEVVGTGIVAIEFGGAGFESLLIVDELRFTMVPAPGAFAALLLPVIGGRRRRRAASTSARS